MVKKDLSLFRKILVILFIAFSLTAAGCKQSRDVIGSQDVIEPQSKYGEVAERLEKIIRHEMEVKELPAFSIALVDDQEIVWARGFGMADPDVQSPASAETVYRIGSVSKLFTDIGIMQLVEKGELDLDAPVTDYLPEFQPENPFDKPITLRQLTSHRSGLVREPPVGNYFDDTGPSLSDTIASLNTTKLVYEPETHTKYSNAGIAVVGYVLEKTQGEPFAKYLKQAVLLPTGMEHSSFEPEEPIMDKLAKAYMWTLDGRVFRAPTFELGMAPCGCMYSTVLDLSLFLSTLFNGGQGTNGRMLLPETLEQMWTPQYAKPDAKEGYGIGFGISELDGHRKIGHGGAIYGFATQLFGLTDINLGVAAVSTLDATNSVVTRIADHALKLMLAVKNNASLPDLMLSNPVEPETADKLQSRWVSGEREFDLIVRGSRLYISGPGFAEVRSLGDTLIVDGRLTYGTQIEVRDDHLIMNGNTYAKTAPPEPEPVPEKWQGLIGEYGWDHNILFITVKDGKLQALIEWFFSYPLEEISADVYAFPNYGLYHGEKLIFRRDAEGKAAEVEAASVLFKRRIAK
ncbi:MAG: beta-lactamase family protein [Candidatus Aminicenantes bacterium]|nr:beta-lactamase family protein [Candidatus Aminicenantes bacterium]